MCAQVQAVAFPACAILKVVESSEKGGEQCCERDGWARSTQCQKSFYYFHAFFGTVLFRMPGLSEWRGLPAPTRGCFASAELAEPALSMLLRTGRAQQGQEEVHITGTGKHARAC